MRETAAAKVITITAIDVDLWNVNSGLLLTVRLGTGREITNVASMLPRLLPPLLRQSLAAGEPFAVRTAVAFRKLGTSHKGAAVRRASPFNPAFANGIAATNRSGAAELAVTD